jgi:hypothetical protein
MYYFVKLFLLHYIISTRLILVYHDLEGKIVCNKNNSASTIVPANFAYVQFVFNADLYLRLFPNICLRKFLIFLHM